MILLSVPYLIFLRRSDESDSKILFSKYRSLFGGLDAISVFFFGLFLPHMEGGLYFFCSGVHTCCWGRAVACGFVGVTVIGIDFLS